MLCLKFEILIIKYHFTNHPNHDKVFQDCNAGTGHANNCRPAAHSFEWFMFGFIQSVLHRFLSRLFQECRVRKNQLCRIAGYAMTTLWFFLTFQISPILNQILDSDIENNNNNYRDFFRHYWFSKSLIWWNEQWNLRVPIYMG